MSGMSHAPHDPTELERHEIAMAKWTTRYSVENGQLHFDTIHALDREHAEAYARKRGVGEFVLGPKDPGWHDYTHASVKFSEVMLGRGGVQGVVEAVHSLVFLLFLADRCGAMSAASVLVDDGLLHRCVHWMQVAGKPESEGWERVATEIRELEVSIPGHTPLWEDGAP